MHLHLHIVHCSSLHQAISISGTFSFRLILHTPSSTDCIECHIMMFSHSTASGYKYNRKHLSATVTRCMRSVSIIECVRHWCMSSYADNDNGYDRALMNHSPNGLIQRPWSVTTKLLQLTLKDKHGIRERLKLSVTYLEHSRF